MSKNQGYSPEFRAEAVRLVLEQGLSRDAAAKRLAIPKGTPGNWVAAAKGRGVSTPGARPVPELEAEIVRLRKEPDRTREEGDILKKATAYFAREPLQGTRS